MNLQEIRKKIAYLEHPKTDIPSASRLFVQGDLAGTIAVTLTLKQSYEIKTPRGNYQQRLNHQECALIANRFKKKLNQMIFGNAAKRFNRSLTYLFSIEGGSGGLNLHLHVAIGGFPAHIKFTEISELIKRASRKVSEINEQIDTQVCDSGWSEYLVKKVGKNSDAILWDLC